MKFGFTDYDIRFFGFSGDYLCGVEISHYDVDVGVPGLELCGGRAEEGGNVEGRILLDNRFENTATDEACRSGAVICVSGGFGRG